MKTQGKRNVSGNRQRIIKFISREKEASRNEIAAGLSLSMPTVLAVTKELTSEGLIEEVGEYESTGGRRAKKLTIVGSMKYSVGVDITANHVSIVAIDLCGNIIKKIRPRVKFCNSLEYFESVSRLLDDFLKNAKIEDKKVLGVGISFPGIIDEEKQVLVKSHALQVENMGLGNISQLIRFPVLYENDANSAALAEMRNEQKDAVYLSLSNTVGGAIFLNGRIYKGKNYRSAEFGHMFLRPGEKRCYCGREGCVDSYCSAKILSDLTEGDLDAFFEKLEAGNQEYFDVWNEYVDNLAVAVSNLRIIFDCEVILGGYVGGYMEKYIGDLRKLVLGYNMFDSDVTFLQNCKFKYEASAAGIAMKFIDYYIDSL